MRTLLTCGHLMSRNYWQLTSRNAACRNQILAINISLRSTFSRKIAKENLLSVASLLCCCEKLMNYLKDVRLEDVYERG